MTTLPAETGPAVVKRRGVLGRFLRKPLGVASLLIFLLIVLAAILAPVLAPYDPNLVDLSITKAPPSPQHWLGGDVTGRDLYSRLLFGASTTIYGAAIAVVTAVVLGVPSGIAAGYFGGPADRVMSWLSDAIQSVPGMLILLIVAAGTRANFVLLMVTIGVLMAPGYYRISRSRAIVVRNEPYIDAAKVSGLGSVRILFAHVVKAVNAPIIIQSALTAGIAMALQAGLQFLGIGSASTPSWGAMMNDGFRVIRTEPLLLLWPSIALGLTIAVLAIMGSTLADVVSAPRPSRRTARQLKAIARSEREHAEELSRTTGSLNYQPEASAARVDNLRVNYVTPNGETEVVHGIQLDIAPGEVLGIVGESGSGKSQTIFSMLDLLPEGGRFTADGMWVNGVDVTHLTPGRRREVLRKEVGYVPQEPMTNLDPSYTIGYQLTEPLRSVHKMSKRRARDAAHEALVTVGIRDPERVLAAYPHELSGGMAQRVLIAGAVIGKPKLIVADEPTTALDVTVQAEVLELLRALQQEYGMALVLVTHNFGVVADICDRVVVMREGSIVEEGPVAEIFAHPKDPYTAELIDATLDDTESRDELDALHTARRATRSDLEGIHA